jgi:UDPglucose 6-dehydrogenase
VDIDESKVAAMKEGRIPIYEPHLDVLFERNIKAGRLTFTTNLTEAIEEAALIFLALPTPPGEDGSADLSYVLGVAGQLGKSIKNYKVIIDKSTVPVGTAEKVHAAVAEHAQVDFDVVSNPEFLREGFAVDDFMKPDRVVIGCSSARAEKLMNELYKPFVRQGNPILFMDEKSAELTKYAANSFLATKITFMNEVANFCELVGADVDKVRRGMGTDTRIGSRFLFPGIGYGGSCFPKDVQALHRSGQEAKFEFGILTSVMRANEDQKTILFDPIRDHFRGDLQGKRFALWGLAFKPETDDIREAPALYMIDRLVAAGAQVVAFDPEAMDNVKRRIGDKIEYADNHLNALDGADALLICTEWQVFRNPDMNDVKQRLNNPVVFDGRNLYEIDSMRELNFYYKSIGRSTVHPV